MDNKEINGFEAEAEQPQAENEATENTNIHDSDAENSTSAQPKTDAETAAEAEPAEKDDSEKPVAVKVKRKGVIYVPVIITGAILVLSLIFFGAAYLFFDNSVEGAWIVEGTDATSDEVQTAQEAADSNTYYIFTNDLDEDGNKIAKLRVGTMELSGTYETTSNAEGEQVLAVSISYFFSGEYNYTVSGNVFTGKTMVLTRDNTSFKFKSAKLPELKTEVPEDFEVREELVGEWNESEYNMTYIFNEDGTAYVNQGGSLEVNGTYKADDSKITVYYLASEETSLDIEYSLDGDTLVLSGLGYKRVE